jgi:hypothetical protein
VVTGHDRVVHANVARFLTAAGVECESAWSLLTREANNESLHSGSPDYPNPLTFIFMLTRAAFDVGKQLDARVACRLMQWLETWLRSTRDIAAAPLSYALAVLAWLNLGGSATDVQAAVRALVRAQHVDGGWSAEAFFAGGYRSRSLTTALVIEALIRAHLPSQR